MDKQTSQTQSRPGVPGLDIFKIAGQSISGFLPSWKTGDGSLMTQPYMSLLKARLPFRSYEEIAQVIVANWPYGDVCSINEFLHLFASRWSEVEVEATVWKIVADATAEGRLLVDLAEVDLSLSTPLALLSPGSVPILPDPLPSSLRGVRCRDEGSSQPRSESEAVVSPTKGGIPGPTFDASVLETAEEQAHFHRNLAAVTDVLAGKLLRRVAIERGMAPSTLSRLVRRTKELGQIACVPYGAYHRDQMLHQSLSHCFGNCIRSHCVPLSWLSTRM